jgi:hypothetical protein
MWEHKIFYAFWKEIYSEVKKDYREIKENSTAEQINVFEKKLIKRCQKVFK